MLIMTFTCVPVASFVSRYMKESFMSSNILYAKVWFQVRSKIFYLQRCLFTDLFYESLAFFIFIITGTSSTDVL